MDDLMVFRICFSIFLFLNFIYYCMVSLYQQYIFWDDNVDLLHTTTGSTKTKQVHKFFFCESWREKLPNVLLRIYKKRIQKKKFCL